MSKPRPPSIAQTEDPSTVPRTKQTLDLERYMPALLVFLANKFTQGSSSLYLKKFGIGVIEWRCMGVVAAERWASPNRICQLISTDKAAVSRALRVLEDKSLVEIRSAERHPQYLEVALTKKGCSLYDRMIQVALERERRLLADFTHDEVVTLYGMMNRMLRRIPSINEHIDINK